MNPENEPFISAFLSSMQEVHQKTRTTKNRKLSKWTNSKLEKNGIPGITDVKGIFCNDYPY